MVKRFIFILMLILMMPVVFAADTKITVQSVPGAEVTLTVLDINTGKIKDSVNGVFQRIADERGHVYFDYFTEDRIMRISLMMNQGGEPKEFKFNNKTKTLIDFKFPTGGEVFINLNQQNPEITFEEEIEESEEEVVEEGIAEEEVVEEEVIEEKGPGITGSAISGIKSVVFSKITYYIIGGLFVLVLIVFVIRKGIRKKGKYIDFKIKSDKDRISDSEFDKKLLDVEKKIKDAEKELEELTNRKKRLKEAEKRFERDKEELRRLRDED